VNRLAAVNRLAICALAACADVGSGAPAVDSGTLDAGVPSVGLDAQRSSDAEPSSDAAASRDAAAGPRQINGWNTSYYYLEDGRVSEVQLSLAGLAIEVLVPDGDDYRIYPQRTSRSAHFMISDVPAGPVLLHVGDTYVMGSASFVEIASHHPGRPNAALASPATRFRFDLSGLSAWTESDVLVLSAHDVGLTSVVLTPTIALGATSLSWVARGVSRHRLDGDSLTVRQLARKVTAGGLEYLTAARALTLRANTISGEVTVRGELQASPQTALELDIEASDRPRRISIAARLGSSRAGAYAEFPEILRVDVPAALAPGRASFELASAQGGDPGSRVLSVRSTWDVTLTSSAGPYTVPAWTTDFELLAPEALSGPHPIRERLRPVRDLAFDGTKLSWSPPELGQVTHYRVELFERRGDESRPVARIIIPDEGFVFPPDLLRPGGVFFARVVAVASPRSTPTRPLERAYPESEAAAEIGL